MNKPIGSKNNLAPLPAIIQADENERLEYLAALLLEIVDEELRESGVDACNLS
ncbi:hypothetical protein JNM87_01020 [Candidatus Saccharibacteria bacterium]|nr:hypothetical protein [Candidatus Saccharibacteria bacterium]